MTSLWRRWRN